MNSSIFDFGAKLEYLCRPVFLLLFHHPQKRWEYFEKCESDNPIEHDDQLRVEDKILGALDGVKELL